MTLLEKSATEWLDYPYFRMCITNSQPWFQPSHFSAWGAHKHHASKQLANLYMFI